MSEAAQSNVWVSSCSSSFSKNMRWLDLQLSPPPPSILRSRPKKRAFGEHHTFIPWRSDLFLNYGCPHWPCAQSTMSPLQAIAGGISRWYVAVWCCLYLRSEPGLTLLCAGTRRMVRVDLCPVVWWLEWWSSTHRPDPLCRSTSATSPCMLSYSHVGPAGHIFAVLLYKLHVYRSIIM